MSIALTPDESSALVAAAATLWGSHRAAFMRDVLILVERGLSVEHSIRTCLGIVPCETPTQRDRR